MLGRHEGGRRGPPVDIDAPAIDEASPEAKPVVSAGDVSRLIKRAYEHTDLRRFRDFYDFASKEIAGPYTEQSRPSDDIDGRRPVNALAEMVHTYLPHLMGKELLPRVDTKGIGSAGIAQVVQARLRRWADDADYQDHDEAGILDSLVQAGIWYVGRRTGFDGISVQDTTVDEGQPFVVRVDPRAFLYDATAPTFRAAQWMGDLVEVDRQALLDEGIGEPDVLEACKPIWETSEAIAQYAGFKEQDKDLYLQDRILLWRFYFRHQGKIYKCVIPPEQGGPARFVIAPFPVEEMEPQPEGWPYVMCALDKTPHKCLTTTPAKALMDMHLAKRDLAAKALRQISEHRRRWGTDAANMRRAEDALDPLNDDNVVQIDPEKLKEMEVGGLSEETINGYAWLEQVSKTIGPSVDLAGGAADPSDTATGSSILAGNAAIKLGKWGRAVTKARRAILRRVSSMLLATEDGMELTIDTPAGPLPIVWNPRLIDQSYDQFLYDITPTGAGEAMDPAMKLQRFIGVLQALPGVVQTAVMFGQDPAKAVRMVADIGQMPELDDFVPTMDSAQVKMAMVQMAMQGGAVGAQGAAPGGKPGMPMQQQPTSMPATRQASMQSGYAASVPPGV